jgi:hypothetical protein
VDKMPCPTCNLETSAEVVQCYGHCTHCRTRQRTDARLRALGRLL